MSRSMPDVRLAVAGVQYGGWTSIRVQRGMEQVSGQFTLAVTERWAGQDQVRPIRPGAECRVLIDGSPVVTGYVDDVAIDYDDREHTISVSGRDRTGDLVDCSAPSTQFAGRTLADVARDLCHPYGIAVHVLTDVGGPFARLKGNEGDSVFEMLESAARIRGVLLMSDGLGGLVIARAGTGRVPETLSLGRNVRRCSGSYSHRDRYSSIVVKGQAGGTDNWFGDAAAGPNASVTDASITRHRPLTLVAEEAIDTASASERAEWERNVRYGRSRKLTYTVGGWSHAGGLWAPNVMVPVVDKFQGLEMDLLVADVSLILDAQGQRAELALVPRETFLKMELPEPGGKGDLTW